jgi:N utilization substance protein B
LSARSKARKRALDMLFQADVRQQELPDVLAEEALRAQNEPERLASWVYAREIVDGVLDHYDEIDEQLATVTRGWDLSRMPNIDRALLRIGTWEIVHNEEVPVSVAIDEAVRLAKQLSTEDSGRFVNGVLGGIADLAQAESAGAASARLEDPETNTQDDSLQNHPRSSLE